MIIVTLLTLPLSYVGWQAKIVRERKAVLGEAALHGCIFSLYRNRADLARGVVFPDSPIPWIRRILDDQWLDWITVPGYVTEEEFDQIRATFPEAYVERVRYHPSINALRTDPR